MIECYQDHSYFKLAFLHVYSITRGIGVEYRIEQVVVNTLLNVCSGDSDLSVYLGVAEARMRLTRLGLSSCVGFGGMLYVEFVSGFGLRRFVLIVVYPRVSYRSLVVSQHTAKIL